MGMLRQTEACILTLFWHFVQPFFAFVPLLVDSLRLLAWDSSFIPWPLAPIVTGRAFLLTSYNQIFIHSNSNFSLLVLDWFRESQRTLTAPPTLGVPTLLRPTPNTCEWIHVYDYDGASRRSVSATTALITFAGVPSELRSCWRSGSFILWGSPLCWPDCCICTLVHQITRLELRPSPYCCWPSMRTAHDCDTIRMQHFHRNSASDKQEQDCL